LGIPTETASTSRWIKIAATSSPAVNTTKKDGKSDIRKISILADSANNALNVRLGKAIQLSSPGIYFKAPMVLGILKEGLLIDWEMWILVSE